MDIPFRLTPLALAWNQGGLNFLARARSAARTERDRWAARKVGAGVGWPGGGGDQILPAAAAAAAAPPLLEGGGGHH